MAEAINRPSRRSGDWDLPRLAVVCDVPVERSGGGALLLYRLLKGYPPDRLAVLTGTLDRQGKTHERLPDVAYHDVHYKVGRLVRNRLNPFWPVVMSRLIRSRVGEIGRVLRDFAPQAVLAVPHHFSWIAAAEYARRAKVPLHLVVHDDWPSYQTFRQTGFIKDAVRRVMRSTLGRVYRGAASRLCVSPGMIEQCREWFGVEGTLLYPNRGDDSPPPRLRVRADAAGPPVVAFCGNINQDGTIDLLRKMAAVLEGVGGRLDLYTMVSDSHLSNIGLSTPAVRKLGYFPAAEMGDRVGSTAHALFLPASFEPRERLDVATLFPSKLADYTAIGLPVLVWGPEYSSAARWVIDNPGSAELVTRPDSDAAREAVLRIHADPAHAAALGAAGIKAGSRCFDLDEAKKILYSVLVGGNPPTYP